MKFRLVWVGSDGEPDEQRSAYDRAAAILHEKSSATGYEIRGTKMVRRRQHSNGGEKIAAVANFIARITCDLVVDDGAERRREFVVEVDLNGVRVAFQMPAAEFGRMGWVLNRLGPQGIIYPGQQQHARAAIQWLSGTVRQERIFTHMGWHKDASEWLYLQFTGALGAKGFRTDVRVQLPPALERYQVEPVADKERIRAIRASLQFLSVAPDRISFPLLSAVFRAPLGNVDFSLFLTGPSGAFKTCLAALCQQHFGREMSSGNLPAHFGSTGNALEELAFTCKDALLVVDDFVPTEGGGELQSTAERLFRAAGNHQGRGRLGMGGRLRTPRPPRALVLATGEEVPCGRSLRARLLIVELRTGEVDRSVLTACQSAACDGEFAASMGAFLTWIAERYEDVQYRLQTRVRELRSAALPNALHARLPTTLAELQSGWEIWLQFALEAGAIDEDQRNELGRRSSEAFAELAAPQVYYQAASGSAQAPRTHNNGSSSDRIAPAEGTKKAKVIAMLTNGQGVSLADLMAATGWQNHTVRGFLSGTVVTQMGLSLSSHKRAGRRVYQIER